MDASELHRHRCEVRHLLKMARAQGRRAVLDYLAHQHVAPRAQQLRKDLNEQKALGNRGEPGCWLKAKEW